MNEPKGSAEAWSNRSVHLLGKRLVRRGSAIVDGRGKKDRVWGTVSFDFDVLVLNIPGDGSSRGRGERSRLALRGGIALLVLASLGRGERSVGVSDCASECGVPKSVRPAMG